MYLIWGLLSELAAGSGCHQTPCTPWMQLWSWIPTMAEAGCDIGGASPTDFDRDPQPFRDATTAVAVPSLPGPGLGTGAAVTPSPAAPVPRGASSPIPRLGFGAALRPEVTEDLPRGEERRLSLILIGAEV